VHQVSLGEFEAIARFFSRRVTRADVTLGVGDDAALLTLPAGQELVAATDTIAAGRHFLEGTPADAIGHQALAVNLSDLAAMGAEPAWALLALSVPELVTTWMADFARGFYALADRHGVALVGGDTIRGPLLVTITVMGFVTPREALRRSGARAGDVLCVSGTPGEAAAGLELLRSKRQAFASRDPRVQRFLRPTPRIALGRALRGRATAAMDLSDGLIGDLAKLTAASGVGARVELESLPLPAPLENESSADVERRALAGGDDYELLFTLPPRLADDLVTLAGEGGVAVHRIGEIVDGRDITCMRRGIVEPIAIKGHDHFAA
jgi:thiamine-monophosphate kinase